MTKLLIRKIGNSEGIIIPKEILSRLQIEAGDDLFLTETKEGIKLSAYDPTFEKQLASAKKGMRKYKNTLRELAK
jgi:putative addiction module antidote